MRALSRLPFVFIALGLGLGGLVMAGSAGPSLGYGPAANVWLNRQ